jgi:ABC-type polysaccharide/polyol phosphate transport system ATPase subunit
MPYAKDSEFSIQVQNLGKCFRIYDKPTDRLKQAFWGTRRQYYRDFWALRNVSIEVRKGETLGIIGRNGSGKSTLLQMICGTLTPTEGSVKKQGRIAALLELGSGFNPEFTGRENIAINARLLGLNEKEISYKYDQIVKFSEIEEFIDQPVKTYSSGMFVRLAFAIASHADPDILIVDEALSVGDFAFQNKCITRIKQLQSNGMTLIFVSHDLSTLQLICDRAIWIHKGSLKVCGDPIQTCQDYYAITANAEVTPEQQGRQALVTQQDTGMARFLEMEIARSKSTAASSVAMTGGSIEFCFILEALVELGEITMAFCVYKSDGTWIAGQTSLEENMHWPSLQASESCAGRIELKPLYLSPGEYRVCLGAYSKDLSLCYALSGLDLAFGVRSDQPSWGLIRHPCRWVVTELPGNSLTTPSR